MEGFRWALGHGAQAVVQMDADFSHAPVDVLRLVEELACCDVAVGSRYIEGGQVEHTWGRERLVLSRTANLLSRAILGLRTRDATSGFKAWRRSALEAVDVGRVRSNGYLFQEEMTYLSELLGLRIREIPIFFADRHVGRSKMTLRTKLEAAAGLIRLRRRHRKVREIPLFAPE
jgi:dolichol-phosphate mannosyltransferase